MSDTLPEVLAGIDPALILDLDVRPDLKSGRDPFQRIMHARQALAVGGVLRLRAIFEPKPLYTVMAQHGFHHWTERLADDDWRVWFYPDGDGNRGAAPAEDAASGPMDTGAATGAAPGGPPGEPRTGAAAERRLPTCGTPRPEPGDIHLLDVRGLEPPEPMVRTLEALEGLEEGHTLLQINDRVPRFLLPELDTRGFQHTVLEDDDVVRVAIRRREAHPVLDVRLLAPKDKHPTIFRTFDELAVGRAFVLVNDHDPVPLRYQFEAERPGAFRWTYEARGPHIWRVRLERTA